MSRKPVRDKPLPWELPGVHYIDQAEHEAVKAVLDSQSLFRFYGPDLQYQVKELEQQFKRMLSRNHALAVSSGTSALTIALAAFNIGPGDEVLLPGYLWISCASAIIRTGAIPRLVDIDDTYCMCPQDLQKKINDRSKVILYIHMSGAMGDIESIMATARKHDLFVLEDCAQAIGASHQGRPAGFFGDIAIFSFQLNKNMTSGEGGLLVCNDDYLYKRCFALHDLGYVRKENGRLESGDDLQLWGIGARMSELTGAVALVQLSKLSKIVSAMRASKYRIIEGISPLPGLTFRTVLDKSGDSGAFLIISFESAKICRHVVEGLLQEGINGPVGSLACVVLEDVDFYWYFNTPGLVKKCSNSYDQFPWSHPANDFSSQINYGKGVLPVCDDLAARSLKLAIASNLTRDDEQDIIQAFHLTCAQAKDR